MKNRFEITARRHFSLCILCLACFVCSRKSVYLIFIGFITFIVFYLLSQRNSYLWKINFYRSSCCHKHNKIYHVNTNLINIWNFAFNPDDGEKGIYLWSHAIMWRALVCNPLDRHKNSLHTKFNGVSIYVFFCESRGKIEWYRQFWVHWTATKNFSFIHTNFVIQIPCFYLCHFFSCFYLCPKTKYLPSFIKVRINVFDILCNVPRVV